jgi:hypothetical protein
VQYFLAFRVLVIGLAVLMIEEHAVDAEEPARRVLLLYPYDNVNPVTLTVGTAIQGFCRRSLIEGRHPFGFYRSCPLSHEANQLGSARNGRQLLVSAGIITELFFGSNFLFMSLELYRVFLETGTV